MPLGPSGDTRAIRSIRWHTCHCIVVFCSPYQYITLPCPPSLIPSPSAPAAVPATLLTPITCPSPYAPPPPSLSHVTTGTGNRCLHQWELVADTSAPCRMSVTLLLPASLRSSFGRPFYSSSTAAPSPGGPLGLQLPQEAAEVTPPAPPAEDAAKLSELKMTGKLLHTLPEQQGSRVKSMAFDNSGVLVLVLLFDSTCSVWDLASGECVSQLIRRGEREGRWGGGLGSGGPAVCSIVCANCWTAGVDVVGQCVRACLPCLPTPQSVYMRACLHLRAGSSSAAAAEAPPPLPHPHQQPLVIADLKFTAVDPPPKPPPPPPPPPASRDC